MNIHGKVLGYLDVDVGVGTVQYLWGMVDIISGSFLQDSFTALYVYALCSNTSFFRRCFFLWSFLVGDNNRVENPMSGMAGVVRHYSYYYVWCEPPLPC